LHSDAPSLAPLRRNRVTPVPLRTPTPSPEPLGSAPPALAPVSAPSISPPSANPATAGPFVPLSARADDSVVAGARSAPIVQLRQAAWMSGTWDARVRVAGAARQSPAGESSYVIDMTMKGRWIFGAEGKGRDFFFLGYDPLASHWVLLQLDGSPGYALLVAPLGWQNGHISFFGDASYSDGLQYRKRATISRVSARQFILSDEQVAPDGSYLPIDRYDFTKVQ
jgi:hypothetical protein